MDKKTILHYSDTLWKFKKFSAINHDRKYAKFQVTFFDVSNTPKLISLKIWVEIVFFTFHTVFE